MLDRLVFKLKLVIYTLILVILVLLGMVIFFKVNEFQSFNSLNQQAGSTESMADDMSDVAWNLHLIAGELNELSFENCMTRAGQRVSEQEECLQNKVMPEKPMLDVLEEADFLNGLPLDKLNRDLIKVDPNLLNDLKQPELPTPF